MMMTALLVAAQVSPPIVAVPSEAVLVSFAAGPVRCGTAIARPTFAPAPMVSQAYSAGATGLAPVTIRFGIDASGRPHGISQPERVRGFYLNVDDLAPALAAWRFASGTSRAGCSLSFIPSAQPVKSAPIAAVHRALAMPHMRGPAEAQLVARARAEAASCLSPEPPSVRSRAFPDFKAIPQPPGSSSYAMVGFDIDAKGRPIRVRVVSSEGNAVLDAAAVRAVKASRFGRSARTGCTYPYHRRQKKALVAPPAPEAAAFRKPGANCDESASWTLPPRMMFPEPFRRRAIEGWAVIGYDVAPWGATGNVTVLASEPAGAFGDRAADIIRAARRPESATGATGCVDRVFFKLSNAAPEAPGPDARPISF